MLNNSDTFYALKNSRTLANLNGSRNQNDPTKLTKKSGFISTSLKSAGLSQVHDSDGMRALSTLARLNSHDKIRVEGDKSKVAEQLATDTIDITQHNIPEVLKLLKLGLQKKLNINTLKRTSPTPALKQV